jgi:5-methylcytosine-specific restriction endonuclease McrA
MTEPRFPNTKRLAIPEEVRHAIFARDGAACRYCGGVTSPLQIDHQHPWAQGGSSDPTNLVVCCRVCNLLASDRVFPEFAAKRDWLKRARAKLGPETLDRIEAALIAGDTAGAMREMERP